MNYKFTTSENRSVYIVEDDGSCSTSLMVVGADLDNTDYQAFKSAVLNQQPGGAVVEDGESFGLNDNPDASILEDADGVQMTIDQAKAFVATLP